MKRISPDGILFVGDLGEGDIRLVKAISNLSIPTAVILGNHDRGKDGTGDLLRAQLKLLGDLHCGWSLCNWVDPELTIVGARPCSAGGGFYLSKEVKAVFGDISIEESAQRIVSAAKQVPNQNPFLILAHSGPTGLGSEPSSPCGRDWKVPSLDWGDKDLELAIDQIRKFRSPDLVVFGHTHHQLKRSKGLRNTFVKDTCGTYYLNAASVPRRGMDDFGNEVCHFSWVEFSECQLVYVSHRWYDDDFSLVYEQQLLNLKK